MKECSSTGNVGIARPAFFLMLAATSLFLGGCFSAPEVPSVATVLPAPAPLAEFSMVDQDGNAFDRDSFRGRWSMVFFGFTHCPDICPVTLQQLSVVRRRMAEADPDAVLPDIVFVSVDPGRDTVATISQYVQAFGEDVIGVRGDPAELEKLTRTFGIYFEVNEAAGDDYTVAHSAAIVIVDDNAEFHAVFSAPHNVDALVHDMSLIIAAK